MKQRSRSLFPLNIILLLVAFTFAFECHSQLRYGFRFGGDFAAARLKNAGDFSLVNRSGFEGGLVLEYQFPKCGFAPEIAVVYARHNTRLRESDDAPFSFGRNFIDVPLRLKYKFWLRSFHDLIGPMLYAGPVFSFKLDNKNTQPLDSKTFQPGMDVGVGFDVVNFIQITGGYRFGLTNSVKDFNGYPDACLRANGWTVAATLLFDF